MRNRDPKGEVLCPRSAHESVQSTTNTQVSWLQLNLFLSAAFPKASVALIHQVICSLYIYFFNCLLSVLPHEGMELAYLVHGKYSKNICFRDGWWREGWTDRWMDGCMNRQTDRWVDRWTTWGRMVYWKDHLFWSHADLGLDPSPATYWLYNIKQVIQPLWVSHNCLVKWQWRVSES